MSVRPPRVHVATPSPDRHDPWRAVLGWSLLMLAACVLSFGAGAVSCLVLRQNCALPEHTPTLETVLSIPSALQAPPPVRMSILLLGSDAGPADSERSTLPHADALMVASFDARDHRLNLLAIPRDTRLKIPEQPGEVPAHAALAQGSADSTRKAVEMLLGVSIDHWIVLRMQGLEEIVNAVGGVPLVVATRMRYRDETASLSIDLRPGAQTLDGSHAAEFVRYRDEGGGDLGRLERQQAFVRAIAGRLAGTDLFARLPELVASVQRDVDTDLTPSALIRLAAEARRLTPERVRLAVLPGALDAAPDGSPEWIPDAEQAHRVALRLLTDAPPAKLLHGTVDVPAKVKARTRISILNGTRRAGLGSEAARLLREQGWVVWVVGTSDRHDVAETEIMAAKGDETLVRGLAETLRVEGRPVPDTASDLGADFTIVLGEDFTMALRQSRLRGAAEEDAPSEGDGER